MAKGHGNMVRCRCDPVAIQPISKLVTPQLYLTELVEWAGPEQWVVLRVEFVRWLLRAFG
jgi:hypothetical protein